MSRTKPNSGPQRHSQPASVNGAAEEVLTLEEAAAYLRFPEAAVLRLVEEQALPARRLGDEWRFLKDAIRDWMRAGSVAKSNKEAWTALAGVWKDDPDLDKVLREIHKQRGRSAEEEA